MIRPEGLKARAREATGLSDFGDAPLDDGLEAFCAALSSEAALDAPRQAAAEAAIVATLGERLRLESWFARHPELLDQTISAPIMVIGLPRTGTTALSQFLSEDGRLRSLRRWEATNATPPPDAASDVEDPRIAATRTAFAARDSSMPTLRSMLPINAEDPSEHGVLMALTFRNLQAPSLYRVPSYADWLLRADLRPGYAYMAKVLKLLQWKSPASHWNLKNPPDIFALDAIAEVFPDARFVWTHRDPADSIPSVCSLVSTIRAAGGEVVDRAALGRMQIDFQAQGVRRAMIARERIGANRFVDVYQGALSGDALGSIRTLYDKLGLPFHDAFAEHLRRRLAGRPRGQHGRHGYTLAEFGLTLGDIRAAFHDYVDAFDVPLEASAA
jgi:hypothetical protein